MKKKVTSEMASGIEASALACLRLTGFIGLIVTFVPVLIVLRLCKVPRAEALPLCFHKVLCRLIGFNIRVRGAKEGGSLGETPTFFVSNHSSYLDIPVLGSLIQGSFVAKSEVGGWPLIGFLSRLQNTVFVERRSIRASTQRSVLRGHLEAGRSLILFPEGTSSDGMRTLPFKSSLFSVVEGVLPSGQPVKVQPISVLCTEIGGMPIGRAWRPYYAWYGDMTLVKHVWAVFKIGSFTVDVLFHPSVTIEEAGSRKMLALYCQEAVASGVNQCVTGRYKKELDPLCRNLAQPPA